MSRDYKGMLNSYLPWYDQGNEVITAILEVLDISFAYLEGEFKEVEDNMFIETAGRMLSLFEQRLKIEVMSGLSLEQRRKQVRAVMHAMHKQVKEELVKDTILAFCGIGSNPNIIRTDEIDTFDIYFDIVQGLVNVPGLFDVLEKMLPAHILFRVNAVYNSVQNLYFAAASRNLKIMRYREYTPTEIRGVFRPHFAGAITKVLITQKEALKEALKYRTADGLPIFIEDKEVRISGS